jgi:hypothetical protein
MKLDAAGHHWMKGDRMTAPFWRVGETTDHHTVIVDPDDNIVATVHLQGPPDRHDAALRYHAEVLASAPDMLYALRTLRTTADMHLELGHRMVASEIVRELVRNVADQALGRIERAREGDNAGRPPRAEPQSEDE